MKRWTLVNDDCISHMATMAAESMDMAVFSPPFPSLYAYTDSESDIGNSEDFKGDAKLHLSFFYKQLARIIKPGRCICVHVTQIPRMKRSGGVGLFDFRGLNIRLPERSGLIYEYDWSVRKNPQSQALRTRSRELQFAGLETDRAKQRGVLPDFILKFRTSGDNQEKIDDKGEVSRNQWIKWAEHSWEDIRETDTLNVSAGRDENDTKHICPLQLKVIHRLIRLFSKREEIVFSPFAGIGSEGYEALKLGRRFYGIELKKSYYDAAVKNCTNAENSQSTGLLF